MNGEATSAVEEVAGAIVAVATLAYPTIRIRQSTKVHASHIRRNFYVATQQQILHVIQLLKNQ